MAGDGAKWEPAEGGRWALATFQAAGTVKVRQHRAVRGAVKTLQLKREHRRWYVIVVAEAEPTPLPSTGRVIGVDMGVARFLTTSDGEIVANPRCLASAQQVITNLQRRRVGPSVGRGTRSGPAAPLAREWRKIRNQRRDFHHKTARALIDTCDVIGLEKLRGRGHDTPSRAETRPRQPGLLAA